jgi:hypothetical protein
MEDEIRAITICMNGRYWYSIISKNKDDSVLCERALTKLWYKVAKIQLKTLTLEELNNFVFNTPSWEDFIKGNMDITWNDEFGNFYSIYKSLTYKPDFIFDEEN